MQPSGSNQSSKGKKAKWDRIVLKVSGEAFAGNAGFGIDGDIVGVIAEEIFQVRSEYEVDIAIVVGGGIFGAEWPELERVWTEPKLTIWECWLL